MILRALLILCGLVIASPALADVHIDKKHRIANRGLGVCAWCALETSGLHLGIENIKGLTERRDKQSRQKINITVYEEVSPKEWIPVKKEIERKDNGGTLDRVEKELKNLSVPHKTQKLGSFKTEILFEGTKDSAGGVMVSLYNYTYTKPKQTEEDYYEYVEDGKGEKGYHSVLLTYIDDKRVKFIDSNDTSKVFMASWKWFSKQWDGAAVMLLPVKKTPKMPYADNEEKMPMAQVVDPWLRLLTQHGISDDEARRLLQRTTRGQP